MSKKKKKRKKTPKFKASPKFRNSTGPIDKKLTVELKFQSAVGFQKSGKLDDAEMLYNEILDIQPDHSDTLHLLGVVLFRKGQADKGIFNIRRAIELYPENMIYHFNLGGIYKRIGQMDAAMACYKNVIRIQPDYVSAYNEMGSALVEMGRLNAAISTYQQAVVIRPDFAPAWYNLGNALSQMSNYEEAISHYQKAVEIKIDFTEAWYNMGNALNNLKRSDEAIICFKKAVAIQPNHAEAWNNMGTGFKHLDDDEAAARCYLKAMEINPNYLKAYNNLGIVYNRRGSIKKALACYRKALDLQPNYAEALNNMAVALSGTGKKDEAVALYRKALEIRPDYAEAYNNLGTALADLGKTDDALAAYQKTLEIHPGDSGALNNIGNLFANLGHAGKAISHFRQAIASNPDHAEAFTNCFHQLQRTCAWAEIEADGKKMDKETRSILEKGKKRVSETPFLNITRHADPELNFAVARSWSEHIRERMSRGNLNFTFEESRNSKPITIGYLSGDFRDHPVGHLISGLLENHDRENFVINGYSTGSGDDSLYGKRIRRSCDKFTDLRLLSLKDAAQRIYDDRVDILVDLMGHTAGNRIELLALRPAPVQVNYLGYPGTTGADFIDYIITDRIVTPEEHEQYYSEKCVLMPNCFQVNDNSQPVAEKRWTASDFGIPADAFIFGSFNQAYKIEPVMFDYWMEIMRRVPGSVLWLPGFNEIARTNLQQEAEMRGITAKRLFFAQRLPDKSEYLARLKLCGLCLDTRIYNGHTTTTDALWAGVPVITMRGSHFASRVSSSILTAVGLEEMIVENPEAYIALAIHLATHSSALESIRKHLETAGKSSSLFNTSGFVGHLEMAYEKMWTIFRLGKKPQPIRIEK
jgi:protein O-GlcNAc transferase